MSNTQPSNFDYVRWLEPWFPVFARVGLAAERDFLAALPVLGLPRKTERAGDFHRAWRNNLRRVCLKAEPFMELKEEPEGQGLDYLLCQMDPERPFSLRWGRFNGETIRRNRTVRSTQIQEQGILFPSLMCPDASELPAITLAHTIEDEYTEGGKSCLWISRLLLLREGPEESELITEVHVYQKPDRTTRNNGEVPPPIVTARQSDLEEYERIISKIRRPA